MDSRSPRVMLPVIRDQGIAYLIGGIFKSDLGASLVQYPSFLRSVGFVVPLLLSQDVVSNTLSIHGYLLISG